MFELARTVLGLLEAGTPVVLARAVTTVGTTARWPGQVLAVAADGTVAGSFLAGAVDHELARLGREFLADGRSGTLADIDLDATAAAVAGLVHPGTVRVLLHPASDVPVDAWRALAAGDPVCLVTDTTRHNVGRTTFFTLESLARTASGTAAGTVTSRTVPARHGPRVLAVFGRGWTCSEVLRLPGPGAVEALVDAMWPTPRLLVVGHGLLADALADLAGRLEWRVDVVPVAGAEPVVRDAGPGDAVVLLSHDLPVDGPLLLAALSGAAGYVGAVGSAATTAARIEWLRSYGMDDRSMRPLHGPAGLDIGARTPTEIAVAIVAEMLAVRAGTAGGRLRDRTRGEARQGRPADAEPFHGNGFRVVE